MAKSYINLANDREVSIGIEQILAAPWFPNSPVNWTPDKILDPVNSPPPGFYHLGTVVEDSVTLSVIKNKFQLSTGIPRALQYEAVMDITGTIEASLIARRGTLAYFGLGNQPPAHDGLIRTFAQASVIVPGEKYFISSTSTTDILTVGVLVFHGLVLQQIVSGNNRAYTGLEDAYIGLASTSSSSPYGVTVVYTPRFWLASSPPLLSQIVQYTAFQQNPLGTNKLDKFHLLGVADFIDGVQIVHDFPSVTAVGDWVEEFRPDTAGTIPIKFEAQGRLSSTYDNSTTHIIIGERYWFSQTT